MNNFMITIGYSFVGKNHFLLRNTTKNGENWNFFLNFFFVFFSVFS